MNEVVEEVVEEVEELALEEEEGVVDPKVDIRIAFDEGVGAEQEEDQVKLKMIAAGATFKNVTRLFNEFMIEAGFAISKSDRNQIIEDTLEGRDFDTEFDFDAAVKSLSETLTGATVRSAGALVRSYAKKNELTCYTKPKTEGGGTRSGFASEYYKFLIGNPKMTKDEASAYIMGEGDHTATSSNVQKNAKHYLGLWNLANMIATS